MPKKGDHPDQKFFDFIASLPAVPSRKAAEGIAATPQRLASKSDEHIASQSPGDALAAPSFPIYLPSQRMSLITALAACVALLKYVLITAQVDRVLGALYYRYTLIGGLLAVTGLLGSYAALRLAAVALGWAKPRRQPFRLRSRCAALSVQTLVICAILGPSSLLLVLACYWTGADWLSTAGDVYSWVSLQIELINWRKVTTIAPAPPK